MVPSEVVITSTVAPPDYETIKANPPPDYESATKNPAPFPVPNTGINCPPPIATITIPSNASNSSSQPPPVANQE